MLNRRRRNALRINTPREASHFFFKSTPGKEFGLLTFEVLAGLSAQPLEERSHHLCTAEALEAGADVLVVPLQSTGLQDPVEKKQGWLGNTRQATIKICVAVAAGKRRFQQFGPNARSFPHQATGVSVRQTLSTRWPPSVEAPELCLSKQQKNGYKWSGNELLMTQHS